MASGSLALVVLVAPLKIRGSNLDGAKIQKMQILSFASLHQTGVLSGVFKTDNISLSREF